MNLFKKIFNSRKTEQKKVLKKEQEAQYLEKNAYAVDELFTINFNKNGGKFLYSTSMDEVHIFLKKIVVTNFLPN